MDKMDNKVEMDILKICKIINNKEVLEVNKEELEGSKCKEDLEDKEIKCKKDLEVKEIQCKEGQEFNKVMEVKWDKVDQEDKCHKEDREVMA
jgi:hypothetical protein